MKRTVAAVCIASLITGCAAPPNTPGAGVGKSYTPVIDTTGVDGQRYSNDLDECRRLAAQIDDGKAALTGAVVGALVGAAIGSAYGTRGRYTTGVAVTGMGAGAGAAGNKAMGRQEATMGNCMAGRGYRVLDGTAALTFSQPSQSLQPQAVVTPPPTSLGPATVSAAAVAPASMPSQAVQLPKEVIAKAPAAPPGQYGLEAAKTARELRCASFDTPAVFVAKGPGFETYSVACTSGDSMMVRCEFGSCRALR